ncbi:uncharacterized protein Arms isoform X11 [Diabrotica undecimpunctata]|uniref:uncharacterized protein Arms isoform X11 n=1 Tax=Diabrotica undecimpunctata TaxID=50387 RepID=UPI003B63BE5D
MESGNSPQRMLRHSIAVTPESSPGRRRTSFLNLHMPETNWRGSLSHLHLPTFTLTTPEGEQSLTSKFTFGLGIRRHSHNTLHRSESMVSLCFRSLTGFINDDNLRGLQSFLESRQAQVDDKDENGTTALMVAAAKGKSTMVRELLTHGADTNLEDNDSWTALLCAAKEGHTDIVLQLLDHNAAIDHRDIGGWSALMWATYKGRVDTALILVDRGADVNAHGNFHVSSLLWASGRGYTDIVECLLQRNAKVNVGDKYGTTALVWASRKGYTEIVELLLKAGANVDTAGMYSWTALLVATYGNHVDVVNLLLEHKPNVNALDKDGCSPLTIACKEGFYEIATALMAAGAYINIQDRSGDTNLIHAVKGGHRGVVEVLLKKYADVDILGKDRKTAIYVAVEKGNLNVLKLLLTCNPDLELATKDGDTPLLKAVRSRNSEIVQLLVDKKAKVSAADKKGDTALHIAMRARSKAIVEILLRNPKNSQLLYRPNRSGETPYNIDMNHQKTILGQIFGARRLNTNEDNENMLGYDLYSSALADILSEPSLSMPIMVGLYAKWGSGKSFLLNKLRDEMKNFAREWVDPVFQFSTLLFLVIAHISIVIAIVLGLSFQSWEVGLSVSAGVIILCYLILAMIWFASKKYDWDWAYNFNVQLTRKMNNLRLMLQILFCHPPGATNDGLAAQPIRFFFTDQTRVSSTAGGENSVVQMIGSLYDAIESRYGSVATRLYRAFKPKPVKTASSWTYRKVCCLPYVIFFEVTLLMLLTGTCALTIYLIHVSATASLTDINEFTLKMILVVAALLLGVACLANMYTWGRMLKALLFSQRRHLQRSISKLETLKSEGFLQTLRQEVNLMKDMVKCLDSLSSQQTRLVVVVDGLDSCEQDKVLLVLDTVHMLFSDANTPFIVILAIDPHVIAKAVEVNTRRLFSENNIGGHNYLSNMVHLPFYLQNSGLRKVKVAQQTALAHRKQVGNWTENDENLNSFLARSASSRRLSNEKALMSSTENLGKFPGRKGSRKLKMSESVASSIGSNLNRIGGAQDLTKMLLTDDYFSDVNPRSMRRLMNVVYVSGRLLKSFQIDFNWYRLASWINITEQWPFRTSWIIHHFDMYEDSLDDNTSLKSIYDKIRPHIPIVKDTEPLLELDRDERKFDIFLSYHRSSLLVSDLKIFLPFTINLDPYLKKVIKEETQSLEDDGLVMAPIKNSMTGTHSMSSWNNSEWVSPRTNLSRRMRPSPKTQMTPMTHHGTPQTIMGHPMQQMTPSMSSWQQPWNDPMVYRTPIPLAPLTVAEPEILDLKLSTLNVDGVTKLLSNMSDLNTSALGDYTKTIRDNNINGRVLLHCDIEELKKLLKMNFGDWEMFKVMLVILREQEIASVLHQEEIKPFRIIPKIERKNSNKSINTSEKEKLPEDGRQRKQSIIEKQVTLEDQMICGALQTLNEEACEDVMEETEETKITIEPDVPQTSVIPPSPDQNQVPERKISVGSMGKYSNLKSSENSSKGRHVVIKTELPDTPPRICISTTKASVSYETPLLQEHKTTASQTKQRPSSLNFHKGERRLRTRSKSIDNSPKGEKRETKINLDTLHRLKEKLLHSSPDLNETSDNESTPLVSEVSTPSKSGHSSEIRTPSSRSYPLSPVSQKSLSPEKTPKVTRSEQNLTDATELSQTNVFSEGFTEGMGDQSNNYAERRRTISDDIGSSVSLYLGSIERSCSNFSVPSSQSSGRLSRQDNVESQENLTDIYCDPGSKND